MKLIYFAYGSNMLSARLLARCSSARVLGRAELKGFEIAFAKKGRDGSAKATVVRKPGGRVHGVAFHLSASDAADLDAIEGDGYRRLTDLCIDIYGPDTAVTSAPAAFSYFAASPQFDLVPFDWYIDVIRAGAEEHGLPRDYIARLGRVAVISDPDTKRPGAIAAR